MGTVVAPRRHIVVVVRNLCAVRDCPWSSAVRDNPQNNAPWEASTRMSIFILLVKQQYNYFFLLQDRVRALSDVGGEDFTLSACGAPLDDGILVSELASTELDLTVPLLGGKVHGSLARAGKVKGQTPKVEKQQKKKKKTGRAKRRIQYNRRFVNVVQTFGRRRGPNSNS
ncbi:uncharacterized protein LOC123870496 [Maniola jurtina]|uniref:uncharacterized protein LOC123870496 n=1 Tax=Maniola jurtina TaxID=191418 RepID=UPI001E687F9A|nr:uncharacterized protein LOC123870496 [Maniola jurtina]